jgi:hypothetical protein
MWLPTYVQGPVVKEEEGAKSGPHLKEQLRSKGEAAATLARLGYGAWVMLD